MLHQTNIKSTLPRLVTLDDRVEVGTAILEPLGLSYVIQNEVIKVTSAQMRDQDVYHKTYYVADLVIPIPNFVPSYYMGLPGALANAQRTSEHTVGLGAGAVPLTVAANQQDFTSPIASDANVLANVGDGPLGGESDDAFGAHRMDGVYNYLSKPLANPSTIIAAVNGAIENRRLKQENKALLSRLEDIKKEQKKDISDLCKAQEHIRLSKKMLQSVFDGISDPLIMVDRHHNVRMLNRAAKTYYKINDYWSIINFHSFFQD